MKNYLVFTMATLLLGTACSSKKEHAEGFTGAPGEVKLITLDPGHFHAALVQKVSYPQVSKDVYVYAPTGFDVNEHLKRIEGFNTRAENPTQWNEIVYTGTDYLEKMLAEKKGNVMIQAGNNGKKTEYIKNTLEAGINVLSDKPMAINSQNFKLLEECFDIARQKNVLLYDIMTERNEITTMLQRELSTIPAIYGEQLKGSPDEPAIVKESVHHLFKLVDNKPLTRPVWYFDVTQQGEGIVDVTTHLVDLVQWEAFPEQIIDYKKDIELVDANRWTNSISPEEFKQVTGTDAYPDFLKKDVENDTLRVYCNGDIVYKIETARKNVIQTQDSLYREILANLATKQKQVLQAIAKEREAQGITSSAFIKKYNLPSASSVQAAVKGLMEKNLITQTDGVYRVYDYFFADWLATEY